MFVVVASPRSSTSFLCLCEEWVKKVFFCVFDFQYLLSNENKYIYIFGTLRFSQFYFRSLLMFLSSTIPTKKKLSSYFRTFSLVFSTNILFFSHHFQAIWVCILCRKKQELLSKTGQWINKAPSPDGSYSSRTIGGVGVSFSFARVSR